MNRFSLSFSTFCLSLCITTTGCSEDPGAEESGDSTSEESGSGTGTGTAEGTGTGTSGTGTSSDTGTSTASTSSGTSDTGDESESGGTPGGQGDECAIDDDCADPLVCHPMLLQCSECKADVDCYSNSTDGKGTCSPVLTTGGGTIGAECSDGSEGSLCMDATGCQDGLVCAPIPFAPQYSVCSECGTDADCSDGKTCTPNAMDGTGDCVDPGSVADGGVCPVDGMGVGNDAVCASGHCYVVTFGSTTVGVCGECGSDADCTPPETCQPPTPGGTGLTPPTCGGGGTDSGTDTGTDSSTSDTGTGTDTGTDTDTN